MDSNTTSNVPDDSGKPLKRVNTVELSAIAGLPPVPTGRHRLIFATTQDAFNLWHCVLIQPDGEAVVFPQGFATDVDAMAAIEEVVILHQLDADAEGRGIPPAYRGAFGQDVELVILPESAS